ncbi:InlB B-repeat-containing protein [Alkalihalobacillus deserti]|uniref:InlB B-repeat-containing protein n=1 Tax=Alkalihalobacillus deserti TaxID=2879466 RepID=UPI001D14EA0B|nr:tetratricopeptide repeat protein [Alkalihalobacillus deserti]
MSKKIFLPLISFILVIVIGAVVFFPFQSSGQISKLEQVAKNSFEQADFESSIEYYKEILELDPTHIQARIGLANSYQGIARLDLAEETLLEGIQLTSAEPLFYSQLSKLYLNQSDILSALTILEQGMDNTDNAEFKEEFETFLSQIKIEIERPFIQKGFERLIHFVWSDDKGRIIPLEAEWKISDTKIASLQTVENEETTLKGLTSGSVIVTATAQELTRELEIEIKEQVVEEMDWTVSEEPILGLNQEIELKISAFDSNKQPVDISPDWTLKEKLGKLTPGETNTAVFTAHNEGVETIYADYDGLQISIDIRVAGEKKTLVTTTSGEGTIKTLPQKDVYETGETIQIQAKPEPGWTFVRWEGDLTGTTPSQSVTMDSHLTIRAIFENAESTYALLVATSGHGKVLRSSLSENLPSGESVTLTARPQEGYEFERWTGSVSSTNPTITVIMDDNLSVRAVFKQKGTNQATTPVNESTTEQPKENDEESPKRVEPPKNDKHSYPLSISTRGDGSITRSQQNNQYEAGTSLTLRAQPKDGWSFIRWEGSYTGATNPLTVTMDQAKSIIAVFEKKPTQTFTLRTSTQGQGSVRTNPSSSVFESGTIVTLTAIPQSGWKFTGWSGTSSINNQVITVTVNSDVSFQANFEQITNNDPEPDPEEDKNVNDQS